MRAERGTRGPRCALVQCVRLFGAARAGGASGWRSRPCRPQLPTACLWRGRGALQPIVGVLVILEAGRVVAPRLVEESETRHKKIVRMAPERITPRLHVTDHV